jgi:hypothetical protein
MGEHDAQEALGAQRRAHTEEMERVQSAHAAEKQRLQRQLADEQRAHEAADAKMREQQKGTDAEYVAQMQAAEGHQRTAEHLDAERALRQRELAAAQEQLATVQHQLATVQAELGTVRSQLGRQLATATDDKDAALRDAAESVEQTMAAQNGRENADRDAARWKREHGEALRERDAAVARCEARTIDWDAKVQEVAGLTRARDAAVLRCRILP